MSSTMGPSNEERLTVPAETVAEVMASDPVAVPADCPVSEAARRMAENAIGSVVVLDGAGELLGICTDRDITVRVTAVKRGPDAPVREACTARGVVAVGPDTPVREAALIMRRYAVRRLPVVLDGRVVGVVSLGDLVMDRDPYSVLADISAADPHL